MLQLLHIPHLTLQTLVTFVGYPGIFGMIFAESGLPIGFFLPGSSLIFTAGLLASQGFFNIWILTIGATIAAIVGDNVGYWFGSTAGLTLYKRSNSRFFKREHLIEAQKFYDKYGLQTIIIARFVPVIRTFVPIIAGIAGMEYRRFLFYNVIGGALWAGGTCIAGYYLGRNVPWVAQYQTPVILGIIFFTTIPLLWEFSKRFFKKDSV